MASLQMDFSMRATLPCTFLARKSLAACSLRILRILTLMGLVNIMPSKVMYANVGDVGIFTSSGNGNERALSQAKSCASFPWTRAL